jgi:hypothetical protein
MSNWYIRGDFIVNLDRCTKIKLNACNCGYSITFYKAFDDFSNDYNRLLFETKNDAKDCLNEIKQILYKSKKDKYSKLKHKFSKLKEEMNELREMIKHLPVVGSVYVEAKDEFEASSKK